MKLSAYRENYYALSGTASSVSRQIAFAGIALIWVFKGGDVQHQTLTLPKELLLPSAFLIVALTFDLLQYVCGAAIWGYYCRRQEQQVGPGIDPEFAVPIWFNWPALAFFWGKVTTVVASYVFLFKFAISSISFI